MTDQHPHPHPHPAPSPASPGPWAAPSSAADGPGPIVHEFTATGPIDATIQNLRGDVVLRAEHGTAVRVELRPRGEAGRELVERMGVRFEADRLFVDAPSESAQLFGGSMADLLRGLGDESGGTSWSDRLATGLRSARRGVEGLAGALDVTVLVPRGSRVVLHDGAGDVRVHGVLDQVEARTGAGDLSVERGGEASTRLTTGTGDIIIGPTTGSLSATTGTGDVVLERSAGRTSITTGVGDVRVRSAHSGHLSVRSGLGDITLHVAPGTATHLDLATGLGDRDVRLTPTDGASEAERTLEVEARAGKGDLRVLRAEPTPQTP